MGSAGDISLLQSSEAVCFFAAGFSFRFSLRAAFESGGG